MTARRGRIVNIEGPGVRGKFVRVTLDSGDRVHIAAAGMDGLMDRYRPSEELVFVETGLLGKVSWIGTADELAEAVRNGQVRARDL